MLTVHPRPIDAPEAGVLLREYFTEMIESFRGHRVSAAVVEAALARDPGDDLATWVVAVHGDDTVGLVGLRLLAAQTGEVKRMYVRPPWRRRGVGRRLLAEVERQARLGGVTRLRLDTRHDRVAARALYTTCGYVEIPAYNDDPYAAHWFEKLLGDSR